MDSHSKHIFLEVKYTFCCLNDNFSFLGEYFSPTIETDDWPSLWLSKTVIRWIVGWTLTMVNKSRSVMFTMAWKNCTVMYQDVSLLVLSSSMPCHLYVPCYHAMWSICVTSSCLLCHCAMSSMPHCLCHAIMLTMSSICHRHATIHVMSSILCHLGIACLSSLI